MSISKIFIPNFVCIVQVKDAKHIRRLFFNLGHAPVVGLWGAGGDQGVKKYFWKHGRVAYQIDRDDKQNKMQVKLSS